MLSRRFFGTGGRRLPSLVGGFVLLPILCSSAALAAESRAAKTGLLKVGDTLENLTLESVEGMSVSLRPAAGKLLHIHCWNPDLSSSDDLAAAAIVLYRRFHASGLNALSVCFSTSEERSLQLAEKWNLPWPVLLDPGPGGPLRTRGVVAAPFNMVVDSQGKILSVGLSGEQAHAEIARLLGVSLAELPMPDRPEPRSVRKVADDWPEYRDLVHGNARVYMAAAPLSPRQIELVWSAGGLPGGAGYWQNNYTVFVEHQQALFEPYRAELQVAHHFKGPFRKLADVPAARQRHVWDDAPAGKLLWYRLILRDEQGRVAGVSDLAPGVTGENLIPDGGFEACDAAAVDSQAGPACGWNLVARKSGADKPWPRVTLAVVEEGRPFSIGGRCLSAATDRKLALAAGLLPADPGKQYWLGTWIKIVEGTAQFEHVSFDRERRAVGLAETLCSHKQRAWLFCAHRLGTNKELQGTPDEWEIAEPGRAGEMPANQDFLRPQVTLTAGKALLDDAFLLEYADARADDLEGLPACDEVKRDEEAWVRFSERREAAIVAAESGQ